MSCCDRMNIFSGSDSPGSFWIKGRETDCRCYCFYRHIGLPVTSSDRAIFMPPPNGRKGGGHKAIPPSVRLSVPFLIHSLSLDGDMSTSLFHTHSIGGSKVGFARIQMLSVVALTVCCRMILIIVVIM